MIQHTDDVPPGGHVGQQPDQLDAEGVEQAVHHDDDRRNRANVRAGVASTQRPGGERHPRWWRSRKSMAAVHRHLAHEVEPAANQAHSACLRLGQPSAQK
jgi:hypothetical protein